MTRSTATSAALCWVLFGAQVAVGQTEPPKAPTTPPDAPAVDPKGYGDTNVRQRKGTRNDEIGHYGVIESIDQDKMVFVGQATSGPPQREAYRYTLYSIDVLAAGKVLPDVRAHHAYRWEDVKVGDTVDVLVKEDKEELRRYVCTIHISRRPGAKLPPSQDMKKYEGFDRENIFNDIDNGLDVTEEDITKAFPAKWYFEKGEQPRLLRPGGLTEEWRKKLAVNRAKIADEKIAKEKGLKAAPPKKDDKK